MRVPTMVTPVSTCMEMADHAVHMLAKFPENPRLADMSRRLGEGALTLENAEQALHTAERQALRTRIDASYENYMADLCMRRVKKQVEGEDGHRDGRVTVQLYASDIPDFTRLQGKAQIDAMRLFELRLIGVQDIWSGAPGELARVTEHRVRYETALDAREQGKRRIQEARVARNMAKERFVQLYAEIVSLVKAEFPRDRRTQELFFLTITPRRGRKPEDGDDIGEDDDLPDLPEDPAEEPVVTP